MSEPDADTRTAILAEGGEILGVTAVLVALLGSAVSTLNTRYIGTMDAHYAGWLSWRVGHLDHFPFVARIPDALVPAGIDLRLLDGLAPTFVGGALTRLFGVYLGYNLMLITGMVLNHLAARRLAGALGATRGVAALCGIAYMAAPVFAGPLQSFPSFLWAFAIPYALAHVVDAANGRVALSPVRLGGWLVVAYLCSIYHLVFGGMVVLAAIVFWPGGALRDRRNVRRLVEAIALMAVVLSPFLLARLGYDSAESRAGNPATVRLSDSVELSANALDPIIPPPDGRALGWVPRPAFAQRPLELFSSIFIGPLLLVGVALAWRRRPRGWLLFTLLGAGLWVLSWGPVLHVGGATSGNDRVQFPYRLLLALPGLGALRAPHRAAFAMAVVAVALIALGLSTTRGRTRQISMGVVGAVVFLGWWPPPATVASTAPPRLAETFHEIAGEGPGAVMVAPWGCLFNDTYPVTWQIEHRHASVGCDTSTSASPFYSRLDEWRTNEGLAALSCDPTVDAVGRATPFGADIGFGTSALTDLRRLGVRWVVFDSGLASFVGCERTDEIADALSGFAEIGVDGRFAVFDLDRPSG